MPSSRNGDTYRSALRLMAPRSAGVQAVTGSLFRCCGRPRWLVAGRAEQADDVVGIVGEGGLVGLTTQGWWTVSVAAASVRAVSSWAVAAQVARSWSPS